ncbi:MAG: LPS export ABC transporter periplasmic protein LptC [Candidatus Acidiferrales bacterium]
MRNQEAARYARWAAMSAGAIALVVAGFYGERALRGYIARRHGPELVLETVHQQFGGVSYSFSNQDGTTFTIRASHATQFKEGDKALLQDVWVTIYGKKGNRNDNIHTRECSYQPDAGNVQCTGDVEIDMQGAISENGGADEQPTAGEPSTMATGGPVHVTTSNVTFNRETGEASTSAPVNLKFAGGVGRGVGLQYNSKKAMLRLQRDVSFSMAASQKTGGLPVNATAANLEFHRDDRAIALGGPVVMRQGDRQLTADHVSIALDKQYHAQDISAEGNPVISGNDNGAAFTVSAQKFEGALDANGAIQQVTADGSVNGTRKATVAEDHFSAERVEFAMVPGRNLIQQMTASGGVSAQTTASGNVRSLKTSALQIHFAVPITAVGCKAGPSGAKAQIQGQSLMSELKLRPPENQTPKLWSPEHRAEKLPTLEGRTISSDCASGNPAIRMNKQLIESAETLGPATLESKAPNQTLNLKAAKFAAQFGADGKLHGLLGHSGVEITRTPAGGEPQSSTAKELAATFGPDGDWATVEESGGVRLTQDGKVATAARAQVSQVTNTITLEGLPVFSDGLSRTSAGTVTINQKTGEIRASGGVISTEMAQSGANQRKSSTNAATTTGMSNIALGEGDAHISGDALAGSINAGDVTFRGHARLWQGQAVLQADQISVSQKDGKLEATGNVVAVFPQSPGDRMQLPIPSGAKLNTAANATAKQTVWQIRAQKLTFSNEEGAAHLIGDVTASSDQGSLHSATMDVYLAPLGASQKSAVNNSAFGGRGVQRAVAQGGVIVSQNGFRGYAQEAQYDAARGKFVFTGGQPRITDGNGNTTTGHSLTFDVASDTISVDSEEGSRTLTRHRVEK